MPAGKTQMQNQERVNRITMQASRKVLGSLAAVAVGGFFIASPAQAVGTLSSSATTGLTDNQTVTLTLTGADFNLAQVTLEQCPRTAAVQADCFVAETNASMIMQDGEGTADYVVKALPQCMPNLCAIFAVEDTNTFDGGSPAKVNIDFAAVEPPPVPEVPLSILLPVGAGAVLGLGTFFNRRRQAAPARV